jgi:DNA repair protein RadC
MTTNPIRLPVERSPRSAHLGSRLERLGPEACDDEELIGLMLGSGESGRRLGRRLVARFGGLPEVARATPAELRIAGVAEAAAPRLLAALEVAARVARHWPSDPWIIRSPTDVAEQLVDELGPLEREELRVLLLDTKNTVTAHRTVYRGNLAGSSVRIGEVYRDAVRACAAAIIVVHNHPSGDPSPSGEDLRITGELAQAGRLLDVELLDHLIVGRGRWTSLRAVGALGQSPATIR